MQFKLIICLFKHQNVNKCPTWCNEELCLGGPQAQEGELVDGVEIPDHRPRLVGDALHQAGHLRRCRVVKAALSDSALHTHGNNKIVKHWSLHHNGKWGGTVKKPP